MDNGLVGETNRIKLRNVAHEFDLLDPEVNQIEQLIPILRRLDCLVEEYQEFLSGRSKHGDSLGVDHLNVRVGAREVPLEASGSEASQDNLKHRLDCKLLLQDHISVQANSDQKSVRLSAGLHLFLFLDIFKRGNASRNLSH